MAQDYAMAMPPAALTDITSGGLAAGGTFLLNITNRGGAQTTVSVALTAGGAPGIANYIEYNVAIPANGVLSRWPLSMGQGWKVFVSDSLGSCSATLIGREE